MAVSSVRNLMSGGGTVSTTSGTKTLTFSAAQSFKEGATIVVDPAGTPQYFTIDTGAGTAWQALQDATGTVSGKTYKTSKDAGQAMPGARARGGTDSYIIPNAAHFMYRAGLDDAGNADFFTYMDTLFPENGVHPFTRDPYAGVTMASADVKAALIPDLGTRVRRLEGMLRSLASASGDITDPDKRLDQIENRLNLLEQWANRINTNSPPATVSVTTYTVEQLTNAGDIA